VNVTRKELLLGIEQSFPPELRDAVRELIRRLDREFDNIYSHLSNPWKMTSDGETMLESPGEGRVYVEHEDGSREEVYTDFGQSTETL